MPRILPQHRRTRKKWGKVLRGKVRKIERTFDPKVAEALLTFLSPDAIVRLYKTDATATSLLLQKIGAKNLIALGKAYGERAEDVLEEHQIEVFRRLKKGERMSVIIKDLKEREANKKKKITHGQDF